MRLLLAASVLFATVVGFQQAPPTHLVLLALIPHIERSISEQSLAPEFVVFADKFTAAALQRWPVRKSPRLAPIGTAVICPWSKVEGLHGYSVRVQLDTLVEGNAVARYEVSCSGGKRGSFATGEVVHLQLRDGKWFIRNVIDRRVT